MIMPKGDIRMPASGEIQVLFCIAESRAGTSEDCQRALLTKPQEGSDDAGHAIHPPFVLAESEGYFLLLSYIIALRA